MKKNVIILGGGIAGMSAAHELIERGFNVTVFEKQCELPGGKARSIPVKKTVTGGRPGLPGEHGFRFFPGFYKHITDTMKRIPYTGNLQGVYDNLVESPVIMLTRMGKFPIITPSHFPRSLLDVKMILKTLFTADTGLQKGEFDVITAKIWQLMTSSKERRMGSYENMSWWDFTEAEKYSEAYKTLFVGGLTRTLVAAKAEYCNTKTNGDVLLQMLFHFTNREVPNDRILCGPTNETWLFPWLEYLRKQHVNYQFSSEVVAINVDHEKIVDVSISVDKGPPMTFVADYFICALPVERTAALITSSLLKLDPSFNNIIKLSEDVAWMNGIQFFLYKDVALNRGHILMVDSPWALTAISQAQFWEKVDLTKYGNGKVHGIISVDVSDWDKAGILFNLPARKCTKKQVILEVWAQMKRNLNVGPVPVLEDCNCFCAYVDESIIFDEEFRYPNQKSIDPSLNELSKYGSNKVTRNEEPLLINKKNTWEIRSESCTAIPNFFLASDYVKTNTDLATMEGANEAARKAVNALLDSEESVLPKCNLWELHEPDWLLFHKWLDKRRYLRGLSWKNYSPWYAALFNLLLKIFNTRKGH